jgi:DNA topoisomerase-2
MFEELTTKIFMTVDNPILKQQNDDGLPIEPESYAPIIPMILINGAKGIGTGFSTNVYQFNPLEVITNIKNKLRGEKYNTMTPWFQGFNGVIYNIDDVSFDVHGNWEIVGDHLIITELPVGMWTSDYKEFVDKLLEERVTKKEKCKIPLISSTDNNTDTKVYFDLEFESGYLDDTIQNFETLFHLKKKISLTNMHLYNNKGAIQKYNTIEDILNDYYVVRLDLYHKRKAHILESLSYQLSVISYKVKFILLIVEKKLEVNNKRKTEIEAQLVLHSFPKFDNSYSYLLSMPIYNLSQEKIEELKKLENEKETEYKILLGKTPEQLWLEDLDDLEESYKKWFKNNEELLNEENKPKKEGKTKKEVKTRKGRAKKGDDEEKKPKAKKEPKTKKEPKAKKEPNPKKEAKTKKE